MYRIAVIVAGFILGIGVAVAGDCPRPVFRGPCPNPCPTVNVPPCPEIPKCPACVCKPAAVNCPTPPPEIVEKIVKVPEPAKGYWFSPVTALRVPDPKAVASWTEFRADPSVGVSVGPSWAFGGGLGRRFKSRWAVSGQVFRFGQGDIHVNWDVKPHGMLTWGGGSEPNYGSKPHASAVDAGKTKADWGWGVTVEIPLGG
jgi:hypothetical protein